MHTTQPTNTHIQQPTAPDLLIVPDCTTNRDFPSVAAGIMAAHWDIPVIDANTDPIGLCDRIPTGCNRWAAAVPSRAKKPFQALQHHAQQLPKCLCTTATGPIDIQCCYPLLRDPDGYHIDLPFGDSMPVADYTHFDTFTQIKQQWQNGSWWYPIMTSLGCPYGCTYCACRTRPPVFRSVENCIAEIREAKKRFGIKRFVVIDDCFNADITHAVGFAEAAAGLGLEWMCGNGLRADRFNTEVAQVIRASGCRNVAFGVESTDPGILKSIRKGETFAQIDRAVRTAITYFDFVNVFLILGLPGSSYATDKASIAWSRALPIGRHISFYVPFDTQDNCDYLFDQAAGRPLSDAYPATQQLELHAWATS